MNIDTKNLWKKNASEVISLLDKKEITIEEVVDSSLDRIKEINFRLTISKPLKFEKNDSLEKISQDLNFWLERTIQNSPNKWIWSHDRWK